MRMEELTNSRYNKSTDSVERYLLELVRRYFRDSNVAQVTSKEYIIKLAVKRMKEELSFDHIGVLSITLPDGSVHTGPVNLSIQDLGGEPAINPKLTAFNVNFGDKANTACEGNDPRLSDARNPLPHQHQISEVVGLDGVLSKLAGEVNRVNGYVHEHNNKGVLDKLIYTGQKKQIDLYFIETLETDIDKVVKRIEKQIDDFIKDIPNKIKNIDDKVKYIEDLIKQIRLNIESENKKYLAMSKQYTDEEIDKLKLELNLNDYVVKDKVSDAIKNGLSFVGQITIKVSDLLVEENNTPTGYYLENNIPNSILEELKEREQELSSCEVDTLLDFESNGNRLIANLPYMYTINNAISGSLFGGIAYDPSNIPKYWAKASLNKKALDRDPDKAKEINNATIIINFYSKVKVSL